MRSRKRKSFRRMMAEEAVGMWGALAHAGADVVGTAIHESTDFSKRRTRKQRRRYRR